MPTPARSRPRRGTPLVRGGTQLLSMQLRAPLFAVTTVLLSIGAHALGGATPPPAETVGILLVAVNVAFRAVARRELSLPEVVAGVGLTEAGLHALLGAGHTTPCAPAGSGGPSGPAMLVAHALAALALAWWLRRGEAAARRTARRLATALVALVRPPALPRARRPATAAVLTGRRGLLGEAWQALAAAPRRGPPALPA